MGIPKRRALWVTAGLVVAIGLAAGLVLYDKLWREQPQPDWILQTNGDEPFGDTQFKYRSIGTERGAGLPYWVYYVLPMLFPEKLPGIGGYASFGLPWEQGVEMPIGLTKVTIGYPRVGFNCALCHTTRYRERLADAPTFVPTGPGHTANIEALSRFFYECAKDPRFNSDNILSAIENFTELDWIDRLLYRFYIIPATKDRILKGGDSFLWNYRRAPPAWGRGSDGPTYSSKYVGDDETPRGHYGSNQFPPIWNLAKYQTKDPSAEAQRLNVIGDGVDPYSVVYASIIGLVGGEPHDTNAIASDAKLLTAYLESKPPARYPGDGNGRQPDQLAAGKAIFEAACAPCHAEERGHVGRPLPVAEVQTDPDYANEWAAVNGKQPAYIVPHLDGIWLRGPYLHNGSVPSLWDLLTPAPQRPARFYRGNDVLDRDHMGFVSEDAKGEDEASRRGTLFDVTTKGNGNQGHEYGTTLSDDDKHALIEYLKTL